MQSVIKQIESRNLKKAVVNVRSGDTVRVHQKIVEGGKERIQIFEGLVIKTSRKDSLTSSFCVRRIASGVGVEKTFLIHSPTVLKIEVVKRSKVRRNYLTYMRGLTGKSARLSSVDFDRKSVNEIDDKEAEMEEEAIKEAQTEAYDPVASKAEKEEINAEAAAAVAEEPNTKKDKIEEKTIENADSKASVAEQSKDKK